MSSYYQTLGLAENAGKAQIRQAYRRLAKRYHPDISREPDAQARFIAITEAYEALMEGRAASRATEVKWQMDVPTPEELRRERAQAYARMRYEEFQRNNSAFQQSWYFLPVKLFTYALIGLCYGFGLLLLLSPVYGYVWYGRQGLLIGLFLALLLGGRVLRIAYDLQKESRRYLHKKI